MTNTTHTPGIDLGKRRTLFEEWARRSGPHITLCHVFSFSPDVNGIRYHDDTTELCWRAWQAGAALTEPRVTEQADERALFEQLWLDEQESVVPAQISAAWSAWKIARSTPRQAALEAPTNAEIIDVLWDASGRGWKPDPLPTATDPIGYVYEYRQLIAAFRTLLSRSAPAPATQQAGAAVEDGIRGPLTDAQRDECRTLYNNLKHLEAGGYHTADDVIRMAAVYGYMNGRADFAPEATVIDYGSPAATTASASEAAYWSGREIAEACVKAGLGVFECNALIVTLQGKGCAPAPNRDADVLGTQRWSKEVEMTESWLAQQGAAQAPHAGADTEREMIVFGGKRMGRTYLAALERDSARYRWLRSNETSLETRQHNKGIINGPSCYHEVEGIRELKWGEELDRAIDAAIAASAAEQKGPQ